MRNFKRFLAMALTMLMLVSSLSLITSAKFEDVTDFQNEIAVLSNLGVIKGKADGTYGFDEAVTRRQTALFFARATTGKVDDAIHWQSEVNTTPFKDLDAENDFYGAISYCHNVGIVLGRSATEFAPNDNITFQEAVTMAVRALGYGGASMDAGYPWTYYSKAVSLGLDKGIEDVALTDVVSRGVMAKLIYNAMFATNSKGSTIAADAFGSAVKTTNLVLVATKGKTLVANLSTNASDKVAAFVEFNSDGTLNLDKVYHFNWADFAEMAYGEGAEEKAADHVGYSYNVVTVDNFKSLVTVSENPSKTFTSADYVGDGKFEDNEYTLVQKWSSVFNIGTTASGKDELIQYNTTKLPDGAKKLGERLVYYGGYYYVVDKDNNILDKDGNVLLYYYEYIVAGIEDEKFSEDAIVSLNNTTFPYYYRLGVKDETAKFYPAILPVGARYEGAATPDQHDVKATAATYATDKNAAKYTKNVSAYADTIVFDDNNDGVYDRAYFTAYNFGRYLITDGNNDGNNEHTFYLGAHGDAFGTVDTASKEFKLNNLTDTEFKKGVTYYVLWTYDPVNDSFTIKKVYDEIKSGYVTAVDIVNKTITFGNVSWLGLGVGTTETLNYGVAKLPGASNTNKDYSINDDGTGEISAESLIGVKYSLLYKNVSYIVDEENDGRIVAILDEKSAAGSPLVITGFDQTSWLTFGNIRAYVIDNAGNTQVITISSINGIPATSYKLNNNFAELKGSWNGLVYGSKQNDGTWLITTNINDKNKNEIKEDITLAFYNGVAFELKDGKVTDSDIAFKHKDGSLVIVVKKDNRYEIAKGVPANGETVTIPVEAGVVYAESGFMYIPNGFEKVGNEEKEVEFSNGWNVYTAYATGVVNDIIYLKSAAFYGGANYTYQLNPNAYFSIITGEVPKYITTFINSDITLEADSFYKVAKTVQNDAVYLTVLSEVELDKTVVTKVGDNYVVDEDGEYMFVGQEIVLLDWRDTAKVAPDKKVDKPKADQEYTVLYYAGNDLSITKRFLLVTKIDKVEEKPDYTLTVGEIEVPDGNPAVIRVYNPQVIETEVFKVSYLTFEVTYYDVESGEVLFEGIATGKGGTDGGWHVEISNFKRVVETTDGDTIVLDLSSGEYLVKVTITYVDDANGKTSNSVTVGPVLVVIPDEDPV